MLAMMSLACGVAAPSSGWAQGAVINLTNTTHRDSMPVWSPDGTKIAFESFRLQAPGGSRGLYVMNADGTRLVGIPGQAGDYGGGLSWSPDGTKIASSPSATQASTLPIGT